MQHKYNEISRSKRPGVLASNIFESRGKSARLRSLLSERRESFQCLNCGIPRPFDSWFCVRCDHRCGVKEALIDLLGDLP
jgi:hypothetical protein